MKVPSVVPRLPLPSRPWLPPLSPAFPNEPCPNAPSGNDIAAAIAKESATAFPLFLVCFFISERLKLILCELIDFKISDFKIYRFIDFRASLPLALRVMAGRNDEASQETS